MSDEDGDTLAAGEFGGWLESMQRALATGAPVDVPCGTCTACCRSRQFVHVQADETETLARIPERLLFPAPGQPAGTQLVGYDAEGRCPMLGESGCSIYEHRPRACRSYDCRVFAATGVGLTDGDRPMIARQARRWRFDYASEDARQKHDRMLAAADSIAAADGDQPVSFARLALRIVSDCGDAPSADGAASEEAGDTAAESSPIPDR